jgi:site-specific DNA-methyltransferase (adenine-specific)
MIKVSGDQYRHPDTDKIYRALPDINGDRLAVAHEGKSYGVVYEEVIEVDNEWSGWGTCLKPAHEPIALARKPTKLSYAENVVKWGGGALNIDATRVPYATDYDLKHQEDIRRGQDNATNGTNFFGSGLSKVDDITLQGRFPSNVIGEIEEEYQKYFYCPKVSRAERHIGMEDPGPQTARERDADGNVLNRPAKKAGASATVLVEQFQLNNDGNNHPTVKPVDLMKYLIKLITPAGGIVLDPFNGSGSTGCAAVELGYDYIGCELDPKYVEISEKRIDKWFRTSDPLKASGLFEVKE